MGLGVWQTFNLLNVEVRVYLGALVFPPSRIYQNTSPGLEIRFNRPNLIPKLGAELTVWIRIGATPVFWYLALKPLRIALVPLRWSASACRFQNALRQPSVRHEDSKRAYGLENNIVFRSQLLKYLDIVEGSLDRL